MLSPRVPSKNVNPFDSAVWPAIANTQINIYIYIYTIEQLYYINNEF